MIVKNELKSLNKIIILKNNNLFVEIAKIKTIFY